MRPLRRFTIASKFSALLCVAVIVVAVSSVQLSTWWQPWVAIGLPCVLVGAACLWVVQRILAPNRALFRALAGTVASYRDGDFSFGVRWDGGGDLGELVNAHNALGDALREQRLALVQRELLLDTMVQNTPVAMILVDPAQRIVLGNLAARKLLGDGKRLEGQHFDAILGQADPAVQDAFARGGDGMFSVGSEDDEDIYHLSRRNFRLNGRVHALILLRQLTAELRRQEVQTWKKVIRVISHELNNSLAPIASLAHSGAELLRREQYERLPSALATIEERARHLEGFIRDYARFAKLPAPRLAPVEWSRFIEQLRSQVAFIADLQPADGIARIDAAQLEQTLINLLKNAHESGSSPEEVRLTVRKLPESCAGSRYRDECRRPGQCVAAVLFHQAPWHRTGAGPGTRDCRGPRRPHRPAQPRRRWAVRGAASAG